MKQNKNKTTIVNRWYDVSTFKKLRTQTNSSFSQSRTRLRDMRTHPTSSPSRTRLGDMRTHPTFSHSRTRPGMERDLPNVWTTFLHCWLKYGAPQRCSFSHTSFSMTAIIRVASSCPHLRQSSFFRARCSLLWMIEHFVFPSSVAQASVNKFKGFCFFLCLIIVTKHFESNKKRRMHSSRMHTARFLPYEGFPWRRAPGKRNRDRDPQTETPPVRLC